MQANSDNYIANEGSFYLVSQKKFTRLAGCEIKNMRLIFINEMSIYQSKANLDEKILFGEITHHFGPRNKENVGKQQVCKQDSTIHSGP